TNTCVNPATFFGGGAQEQPAPTPAAGSSGGGFLTTSTSPPAAPAPTPAAAAPAPQGCTGLALFTGCSQGADDETPAECGDHGVQDSADASVCICHEGWKTRRRTWPRPMFPEEFPGDI
ncbi:unnamed protein product, partial [Prorocentrum cordatum]